MHLNTPLLPLIELWIDRTGRGVVIIKPLAAVYATRYLAVSRQSLVGLPLLSQAFWPAAHPIGMHRGIFSLTDDPMAEPVERADATGVVGAPSQVKQLT